MNIVYYPHKQGGETANRLNDYVVNQLRQESPKQWMPMILWIRETARPGTKAEDLNKLIRDPANKKRFKLLGDGLCEYRGNQNRRGTIRVYFCYDQAQMYILHAELKTDDDNGIDLARKRKKEMKL